jgi:hypothetical protein
MKTLRQYVRRVLTEAAKGPMDLPDGVFIKVVEAEDFISAKYCAANGRKFNVDDNFVNGFVTARLRPTEIPKEMKTYSVVLAQTHIGKKVVHGWGPMLYDVVMERLGLRGYGLAPDRKEVSADAIKVWDFYMNHRGDIEKKQLDFRPDYERHETETPNDDADMQKNFRGLTSTNPKRRKTAQEKYLRSSRSKAYFASGTPTVDALSAAGKIMTNGNVKL